MNLYVHVPFCVRKCRYCAFYSEPGLPGDARLGYPALVRRELELRGRVGTPPRTVYVGGGTPSLLGPDGLRALFNVLPTHGPETETTVELNPGDVTPELAAALRECGVTRASLGAQSFSDETLAWLGRRHDARRVREAFAILRAAGIPRISLDFIAAIPGAPGAHLAESLREAIALGPDHVSVYPLSVEPGTPLAREGVVPLGDDASLAEVAEAEALLGAAGFARYEISNYARPGCECRHNLAVWRGEDYVGLGPAACSREGLVRRANAGTLTAWREALERGELPPADIVRYTPDEDESERFATRVRLSRWQGPDPATERGRARLATLEGLARNGIVRALGGNEWTLTPRGREVADAVMRELG